MDYFSPGIWQVLSATVATVQDVASHIDPNLLPPAGLCLVLLVLLLYVQRTERHQAAERVSDLAEAKATGGHKAQLQYPHIDLDRCLGCGSCARACPEEGVLGIVHGQAAVLYGSRCIGDGACARECPVGAIVISLGDVQDRKDIPSLTADLEATGTPGLFLAGEVTGYALIHTGISHGVAVVDEVARRLESGRRSGNGDAAPSGDRVLDLCIVGAGPAGLAASLEAKSLGLSFLTIERETLGGTVAKYPRRKLVVTQPVTLPGYGRLKRTSYSKEELITLWETLAREHELPIRCGEEFVGLERTPDGTFLVRTSRGVYAARYVCLALGRRGTPRKLGVAGEELPKVAYSLVDAQSYQDRRILVVGGGDSAVEAALALSEQPGNRVTISYRKSAFSRIKTRNRTRLEEATAQQKVTCVLDSEVQEIAPYSVRLRTGGNGSGPADRVLENDEVFIMAGGTPPFGLLEESGVSFDPADRSPAPIVAAGGTDLRTALFAAAALAVAPVAWYWAFHSYYALSVDQRLASPLHEMLRSSGPFGIGCGILATALIAANLAYLLRRRVGGRWLPGSLRSWMTCHVVTGTLVILVVLIHAAIAPRYTVGGHAYLALVFLAITGVIGRYFYALVPRAINGKELELEELSRRLAAESSQWDQYGWEVAMAVKNHVHSFVSAGKWRGGFFPGLVALLSARRQSRRAIRELRQQGRKQGLPSDQIRSFVALAKCTYWTAVAAAHHEDLRSLLASWRFFHRWIALLMVLLAAVHIAVAVRYGHLLP